MKQSLLGLFLGSILIASWFATALSGVMLLQAYIYYRGRPKNDLRIISALVILLLQEAQVPILLDMGHVACIMTTLYHYLIKNFGNDHAIAYLAPSLALTVGFTGTITFFAQSFFTWRVWKLSRGSKIAIVIFVLQIARLTCGWITTAKAIEFGTFFAFAHQIRWIFTAGVAIAVICDILITGSLCYWLHASRGGSHGMDAVIDKIILYTIENGALTAVFSIASLICAICMPGNLVFIAIHFVISKLYINSVLASLNTRNSFRAQKERQTHMPLIFAPSSREGGSVSNAEQNSYALQSPRRTAHMQNVRSPESPANGKIDFVVKTDHVSLDESFTAKNDATV